ncbi:MFS transporter [Rhodoplanes sp. Z2-YC6860]|uniref:MFS transporter n=1 Tax=Rhodoplanes sp. Z2-YC6860 TaxID=674703 RepID=UPI00078EF529|nr:MFS transporter [Rhodoplanes sp. Z2-YC6860]AMN42226.1 MFS family diterpenoid transporter [Rhodoplanes sp. Z2-YC6860]
MIDKTPGSASIGPSAASISSWAPFRHPVFAILWIATVISNIGTWMQNAAAGWLMTGLNPDPLIVSLVQVATTLPMFLFGIPAGALADILDRRKLLIAVQLLLTILVAGFSLLVWLNRITPASLLGFTFVMGVGAALIAPAWQSIVPQLVPREELSPAVAANSVGINVSRAVGPALAGLLIGALGIAAPFWINAVTSLGVIAALIWWRPQERISKSLPPERFGSAMLVGLRHARRNPHLRATLIRAIGFFIFASAYWALLPLVARNQVQGGPTLYGILLGAIGGSAVIGALVLPLIRDRLGADGLASAGTVGTAVALALFGLARNPATALVASFVAGLSWIAVLATINVSAQMSLPAWVRGRGLALFVTVMFGAMSLGSMAWGQVAAHVGLPASHIIAAAALVIALVALRRWKLQTGAGVDLNPSMHWPAPVLAQNIDSDRGPVLVTIEYRIDPNDRDAFLDALLALSDQRRRDGAFEWGVFEDVAEPDKFVETFLIASWIEHLRQHERVTQEGRDLQERVQAFHKGATPPAVAHLIAAEIGA